MKRRSASLSEIAARLQISTATASNALSGKGRVSAELAARVRAVADEIGYVPSSSARALRTGQTGVIGLVLPDIANPLFPQIAQAIEHAAAEMGFGVLIADSRGAVHTQTEAIQRLVDRQVDGLVVIPRRGTRIAATGCPVAMIDSPSTPGNTVAADHWEGGRTLGRHLKEHGHRRLLLVGNNPDSIVQNDRLGGIRAGFDHSGIVETVWMDDLRRFHGANAVLNPSGWHARGFTAFAATSDLQALRILTELQHAGIAVPAMASVAGFDDLVFSSSVMPALTSMRMDMGTIGRIAIAALKSAIENGGQTETGSDMVSADPDRVAMELVIRRSTGPAPAEDGSKAVPEPLVKEN
ncbi:LacI family DNA-binding transcriptional regulator [Martelella sp. HB161492]|uniref:LacI family DNA-binding transcriptional regulator n=1 Tax=Martelella sp. HB161492 TaxID=2720726 RepID=UPI0015902033|nr:LacI family DNA-binding transcriptional regulator [Martelella sp. HB161492]